MEKRFFIALFFLLFSFAQKSAFSQNTKFYSGNKYVSAELVSDLANFQPKKDPETPVGRVGVYLKIEKDWHVYWENSGDAAIPTEIIWELPQGWRASELRWPLPYRFIERGDIQTFGYQDEVLIYSDLYAPPIEPTEVENFEIKANVRFLVCKDICIPGQQDLSKNISYSFSKPLEPTKDLELFKHYDDLSEKSHLDFRISPQPEFLELASDQNAYVNLLLEGRNFDKATLSQELAFFPKKTTGVEIGRAEIVYNETKKAIISFPLKITKEAAFSELKIAGVLGLSEKLIGGDVPLNLPWSFSIKHSKDSSLKNPDFEANKISESKSSARPLSFRSIVKKEKKKVAKALVLETSVKTVNTSLLLALISAFFAGVILNLMPCVLPVISIKIFGFLKNAEKSRKAVLQSSLAFASGIIFSFLSLAAIVIALRAFFGKQLGWGFQFQHPEFVLALCIIVFTLSLGFFEIYTLRLETGGASKRIDKLKHPLIKNFFEGVLATALATPCTAPFLGTALAFAFTQSSAKLFLIFLTLGLGLASPYVYLASHPKVLARLPKPGPWMQTFKELMGFFLLATVVWLLFILNQLTETGGIYSLALLLLIALCFWIARWTASLALSSRKLINLLLVAICLFVSFFFFPELTTLRSSKNSTQSSALINWKAYSDVAIAEASKNDQTIFIDFTADWCITCKANEKLVIESAEVAGLISANNILALKADWTSADETISRALKKYGGTGVPHYVVIRAGKIEVLPTLLTKSILRAALG